MNFTRVVDELGKIIDSLKYIIFSGINFKPDDDFAENGVMKNLPKPEGKKVARLELIILDYDQTTVENIIDFYEAYCQALRIHGSNCVSTQEFLTLLRENRLGDRIPMEVDPTEFWKTFRRVYVSRHSKPLRGLREFLITLKRLNVKIVVISGRETSPRYILWDLRNHGLDRYIDDVLTFQDMQVYGFKEEFLFDKSDLIRYVKKKHGVSREIVCIGDYIADYYSCVKSGGIFIGINTFPERNRDLEKAGVKMLARDFYDVLVIMYEEGLLR
ncbi:MAG: HAD hydrolase-like protein [Desulfurococcaceae archaeon]